MEGLPPEIITNILSRSPDFKSIGKRRCVSKLWHSILSDSTLTTHLSKTPPDLLLHFFTESESRMYYLQEDETLNERPLRTFKRLDESYIRDSFNYTQPKILGSCRGFVCLLCAYLRTDIDHVINSLYVFNPITEEQVKLPPFTSRHYHTSLSGFGFDHSNNVFKVVLIQLYRNRETGVKENELQVHTIGSTTWRSKYGIIPNALMSDYSRHPSTFFNGSLHWITANRDSQNHGPCIVSFNLGAEEFGFVPTPELESDESISYELGLIEEQLSIVEYYYYPSIPCINVWVMEKYNVKESWVKKLSIRHELAIELVYCDTAPKPIKLCKNGELLLLPILNEKSMTGYNTVTQRWSRISLQWASKRNTRSLEVHPIVGSLVSLKEALGVDPEMKKTTSGKRKR